MKKITGYLLPIILLHCWACQQDENVFEQPAPLILPLNIPEVILQEQGRPVTAEIELRSVAGLNQLEIFRNDEPFEVVSFRDELLSTYMFNYSIAPDLPDDAEISFRFELTDEAGRRAESFTLHVKVGPPFTIRDEVVNGLPVKYVKGRLNRNVTFEAQHTYLLDSIVSVEENSTLTIQAGTTIYMKTYDDSPVDSRLSVTRGCRIIANGSKDAPIVFTSDKVLLGETPVTADWGGIFVYGNAPTNQGATVLESNFRYGGTNDNESSGSLRYLRLEYGGKNDVDGIQFFGVGSGTTISHINVYRCFDNAIRFKGGSASVKYLVCNGFGAYGFWAEHGWRGRAQFMVFHTDVAATIIPVNFNNIARCVELRNDNSDFNLSPRTYGYLSNITMIGNGNTDLDGTRRGIRIRRGAYAQAHNIIVTNFPGDAVRVEDVPQELLEDGTMVLADVRAFSNRINYGEQAEDFFLPLPEFNLSEDPVPGISPTNIVGSVPSPFDPAASPVFDSWFEPAPFIGAIENTANDWTADGIWCRDLDGTIR
ncbi:MAG: hypothetical protein ACLFUB_13095 [Cyclobacteriaceae bacterium]